MKITESYPVLMVTEVAAVSQFYRTHFGFAALFESDWYVYLRSLTNEVVNLGILDCRHDRIPESQRGRQATGLLINIEVPNVDHVHAAIMAAGLLVIQDLRDEPFGQRHFIMEDPAGVMVDVITPIPPSAEFAAQYSCGNSQG